MFASHETLTSEFSSKDNRLLEMGARFSGPQKALCVSCTYCCFFSVQSQNTHSNHYSDHVTTKTISDQTFTTTHHSSIHNHCYHFILSRVCATCNLRSNLRCKLNKLHDCHFLHHCLVPLYEPLPCLWLDFCLPNIPELVLFNPMRLNP